MPNLALSIIIVLENIDRERLYEKQLTSIDLYSDVNEDLEFARAEFFKLSDKIQLHIAAIRRELKNKEN